MGSPNSIVHLVGSGMPPRPPRSGKVGVMGMYGNPNSRARAGMSPIFG